jgi:23S rRNA pseudouridine1911/1915/1917 synthase
VSNGLSEPEQEEWEILLEVPPGYKEDARLDVYLTRFLPNASRAKVQTGIKEGRVIVNDAVLDKSSYKVQAGDRILCRLRRPPPTEARPEQIPLDIVFEDDYLIVLNKPAGMVVHPAYANLTGTLVNALLYHVGGQTITLDDLDELDEEEVGLSTLNAAPARPGDLSIRPGIVHRLDKDTSGLMVVAKDDDTHRKLARQFEQRTTQRQYTGIAWGIPEPPEGRIEGDIARDPRDRKRMAVLPSGKGKHAVTHYIMLERLAYVSVLQFRLETGRTHQIRVHAQIRRTADRRCITVPTRRSAAHSSTIFSRCYPARRSMHKLSALYIRKREKRCTSRPISQTTCSMCSSGCASLSRDRKGAAI